MKTPVLRFRFTFSGRVQGVGFRPAIYRLATELELAGWVGNTPAGVVAEVEGSAHRLAEFRCRVRDAMPSLARIDAIEELSIFPQGGRRFALRESEPGGRLTLVPPDLALCDDCRREMNTPGNRRFGYAFINCTRCGPRYSITEKLPYDRDNTVMRRFPMCSACAAEYADPSDRRFHHQTITCPQCGPQLAFWSERGDVLATRDDALARAVEQLRAGAILAVKGLGGFHLLADATAKSAIERLRAFKRRPSKPFGVMFGSLSEIERCCPLDERERATLDSPESPLLLADWNGGGVDPLIAPGLRRLGTMLPYTPLHALLLQGVGKPVLATSGNRGGEPICIDEIESLDVFAGLVDGWLVHDRPIVRRVDDSVVQYAAGAVRVLRRARGWVPSPFPLKTSRPALLATGGHQKNTVALVAGDQLVVSSHIGDLDSPQALAFFEETVSDLGRLLETEPTALIGDAHADYASSAWSRQKDLPRQTVQHHIAHLAGCALENRLAPPFAGCVWDGSGLGADGQLWGGETLLLDTGGWRRLAHFVPFPLPGGEAAAREPRRALLGLLLAWQGDAAWDSPLSIERFSATELKLLRHAWEKRINVPFTSSVGRLFDGIASLLGLCHRQTYEGEAATLLQTLAESVPLAPAEPNPMRVDAELVDWRPFLSLAVERSANGSSDAATLARLFHDALAQSVAEQARLHGAERWLLTGGCFQNRLLLNLAVDLLGRGGVEAYAPSQFPSGDGGLAFGQIAYAAWVRAERPAFFPRSSS